MSREDIKRFIDLQTFLMCDAIQLMKMYRLQAILTGVRRSEKWKVKQKSSSNGDQEAGPFCEHMQGYMSRRHDGVRNDFLEHEA